MKYTAKQLEKAKQERERMIAELQSCTCAWPVTRYRNGSGHDPSCPAHKAYTDRMEG